MSKPLENVTRGGTVPIVLSYRRVSKRPKLRRVKRFVGFRQVARNLVEKAIDFVQEVAYETDHEVLECGKTEVVHWALQVADPWSNDNEGELVVTRVPDKPACGANFEIITIDENMGRPPADPGNGTGEEKFAARPVNHEVARQRMREMLAREAQLEQDQAGEEAA